MADWWMQSELDDEEMFEERNFCPNCDCDPCTCYDCHRCQGTGRVLDPFDYSFNSDGFKPCPDCGGQGE